MTESLSAVEVPEDIARSWLEHSLAGGHEVSAAVLADAPFGGGRFHTFVPADTHMDRIASFQEGGLITTGGAVAALAKNLDDLARDGASCVIIEDDLARRTDPAMAQTVDPSAFIGDRVVSWSDFEPGSGTASAETIERGASGYPLNAFISTKSASDLGLVDRQPVPEGFANQVAQSLLAVVVSALDAESFLIWDRR